MRNLLVILLLLSIPYGLFAQFSINSDLSNINYSNPKEYEIGGIVVSGTQFFDNQAIISLSGLVVGSELKVPGEKISNAIKNLWAQKLFSEVEILATKIEGNKIFLEIKIQELPRLSKYKFVGVKKSKQKDLREQIGFIRGKVITENLILSTKNR
ncbi:MAG: outer membrane protein assembly factor BamA, partial [Flavobacteriales bacterium]|nr:outer membrane protein assembly factor BamA [Flavobacteriales bacterium]